MGGLGAGDKLPGPAPLAPTPQDEAVAARHTRPLRTDSIPAVRAFEHDEMDIYLLTPVEFLLGAHLGQIREIGGQLAEPDGGSTSSANLRRSQHNIFTSRDMCRALLQDRSRDSSRQLLQATT